MNIGPTEIILVLAIALLVFGPSRLPQMGRTLGRGLREFKNAAATAKEELGLSEVVDEVNAVKDDITSSLGVDELKETIGEVTSPIDQAKRTVTSAVDEAKKSVGADEIAAGVGSVKTVVAFDPRKAAKGLLKSKPAPASETTGAAADANAGAEEPASSAVDLRSAVSDPQSEFADIVPPISAGA
jgi:sec-independent protein translocase protein TatA